MNRPSSTTPNNIAAIILAGGENRRMEGKTKIFLNLDNQTLLQHTLLPIQAYTQHIALSFNDAIPAESRKQLPQAMPILSDASPTREGPLAGVMQGLRWMNTQQPQCDWLLTLPGDTPFLPHNLVALLSAATAKTDYAAYIHWRGRDHFLTALWHRSSLPLLTEYLEEGKRSAKGILSRLNAKSVILTNDNVDAPNELKEHLFFNINTPSDFQHARAVYQKLNSQ